MSPPLAVFPPVAEKRALVQAVLGDDAAFAGKLSREDIERLLA